MSTRTEISSLGEFGLIDRLTADRSTASASTILGVGDDAAVIEHDRMQTVISTDMLVEGIHFDLAYTPLKHLGYKAIAVNLSDIYAMMARPTQVTVSIAVSNRFSVEALDELYDGIYTALDRYGADLVGGDTTAAPGGLIISVTAIGEVAADRYVTRGGAGKGDLICVSGDLGGAYLGLQILEREKKIFLEHPGVQPDLENRKHVIGRILRPEPRADIVDLLREAGVHPTAMIDVSDGLSSELLHISRASGLGCIVHEDKIPLHEETKETAYGFGIDPTACALSGGEDYELLFTVPQNDYEKIARIGEISVIGYMTAAEEGTHLITRGGNKHALVAQGWTAFNSAQGHDEAASAPGMEEEDPA